MSMSYLAKEQQMEMVNVDDRGQYTSRLTAQDVWFGLV